MKHESEISSFSVDLKKKKMDYEKGVTWVIELGDIFAIKITAIDESFAFL